MGRNCYICDIAIGPAANDYVRVFGDGTVLQSGKKLHEVIADIVEQTLHVPSEIASVVCKKCQKACSVYDSLKTRLQVVKCDLRESFRKSNIKRNGNLQKSPVTKETRKVVVPASKLQPLPANYLINMAKLAPGATGNIVKVSSSLKTIATSPTIQKLKTTNAKSPLISSSSETDNGNQVVITSVISTNRTKNPVMSFNVNSLPKNFLSKDAAVKSGKIKKELDDDESENNDEQPMEIDEDCSLAAVGTSEDGNGKLAFDGDKKAISNLFDMGLLLSPEDPRANERVEKLILDKLKMLDGNLDDDDDDEQTIVMENGTTIIRMGANQQVTYDGEHYALVPAASDQENDDNHDSNDESQIELQVSGDEETANAIIAAAQERGGAFIKVESGEMYRVKSVQSKTKEDTQGKMHIENLVEALDEGYKCLLCEKNKDNENYKEYVGDAEAIMAHLRNKHTARVYICQICGDVMRKKVEYTTHMEEHAQKNHPRIINKTRLHECEVCKRKYNSRTLLNEHMNMHTGERPFTCAACGKSFASKYTLQAHSKTHEERPRPFKCHCGKAFLTQQNLTQHEKTHSGIKEFVCKICDKAFATQHNLEVHYVVHTGKRPYLCQYCNKGFARKAEVKDHMRTHTGERPFACDICGATFTQRSNLHSHKRATHLDDKRHHCTQCSKRFKRRRLLEYHIKAAHTGERPLQCEVCRATFVYPEHYKKHVRIHSGERPYVCEVCGKAFNSRDNRNTHRFVHSDKKPYECLACGLGYMRKQLLYAHMNSTGHVAESIVVNQPRVIKAVDNIFGTTTELELDENDGNTVVTEDDDGNPKLYISGDKKIVLQDKSAINVLQDHDDSAFLIHNLNGLIEANADDKLQEQATIVTTDEKGATMRLIQVQLEDGKSGWVAINN